MDIHRNWMIFCRPATILAKKNCQIFDFPFRLCVRKNSNNNTYDFGKIQAARRRDDELNFECETPCHSLLHQITCEPICGINLRLKKWKWNEINENSRKTRQEPVEALQTPLAGAKPVTASSSQHYQQQINAMEPATVAAQNSQSSGCLQHVHFSNFSLGFVARQWMLARSFISFVCILIFVPLKGEKMLLHSVRPSKSSADGKKSL